MKFIAESKLTDTLARLAWEFTVWVPVKYGKEKSKIEFLSFSPGMEVRLDQPSTSSPKHILFPREERLLEFRQIKPTVEVKTQEEGDNKDRKKEKSAPRFENPGIDVRQCTPQSGRALIFGARPCDSRGFMVFDEVYLKGRYKDPYYEKRRTNTVIATLACTWRDSACFCSAVGSGPADPRGSDILVISIPNQGFALESLTEKGEDVLSRIDEPASAEQVETARQIRAEIEVQTIGEPDLTGFSKAFNQRFTDLDYWRKQVEKCLHCGICTYLCPTCYCFTISDETRGLTGVRLRSWDSCMFQHFTLEASGHNPRPTRFERYRNRVGHKFSYFPDNYNGMIACCGCGRCIRNCPVSVDIRQVVREL